MPEAIRFRTIFLPRLEHHAIIDRIEEAGRRLELSRTVGHRLVDRLHDIGPAAPEPEAARRQRESARALRLLIRGGLLARYLASERRIPFNESGVFRHYPELDQAKTTR
jgi:glutathione S-transferase